MLQKQVFRIFFGFLILSSSVTQAANKIQQIPHIDLEASSQEYTQLIQWMQARFEIDPNGVLDPVIKMGKRNLDWLQVINQSRAENDKLSFSSKATQSGIPIESPKLYNENSSLQSYLDLKRDMPKDMGDILFSSGALTSTLPLTQDEYLKWGRKADGVYQTAARWLTMKNYLPGLAARKARDVRGIYFLRKDVDRDSNFANFSNLPQVTQDQYKEWLTQMCLNSGISQNSCQRELQTSQSQSDLSGFYKKYLPSAENAWNSFYFIPNGSEYPAANWTSASPDLMTVPFEATKDPAIAEFLRINLEDEWKWLNWSLRLDFANTSSEAVKVIWQPGIVPHVPYLGSNEIYMDSNAPISEYNVQWTIRHEFGHVLGFPDCYQEFYDQASGFIVSYQLDITDLMCSRRGKISDRHHKELQRVYFVQNNAQQK